MIGRPHCEARKLADSRGLSYKQVCKIGAKRLRGLDADAANVLLFPRKENPESVSAERGNLDITFMGWKRSLIIRRKKLAIEMKEVAARMTGEDCRMIGRSSYEIQRFATGKGWVQV